MATVPVLDGPAQSGAAPLQPVYQQNVDVSSGLREAAAGIGQAGDQLFHAADQQARTQAWQTDADLKVQFGQWQADTQSRLRGAKAGGGEVDPTTGTPTPAYADQVRGWFDQKRDELMGSLGPAQRALVSRSLAMYQAARVDEAYRWQKGQTDAAEQTSFAATQQATADAAIKSGDPNAVGGAAATISENNARWAQAHGITAPDGTPDPNWLRDANEHDLTALHAGMIEQLQRSDPAKAGEYLAKWEDQIRPEVFTRLRQGVQEAGDSQAGFDSANKVWSSLLPAGADPSVGATAIPIEQMVQQIGQQFSGNPVARRAAESQVAELYRTWNESQASAQRAYKSALLGVYTGGGGLQAMQKMPEWQKLDGDTREAITTKLEAEQDRRLLRSVQIDQIKDRQDAAADRARGFSGFGQFVDLVSNPDKVAAMTPQDVQNLPLTMSRDQAAHVAEMKTRLATAADVKNAHMDVDQFNQLASSFGFKTPADQGFQKAGADGSSYATLRMNVDNLVQQAQGAKKMPLTPDEKATVMRNAMAQTVTVNPGLFSFSKSVAVPALTAQQRAEVVVPDTDRAQILDAFKAKGKAPTDDEVRTLYLRRLTNGK